MVENLLVVSSFSCLHCVLPELLKGFRSNSYKRRLLYVRAENSLQHGDFFLNLQQ